MKNGYVHFFLEYYNYWYFFFIRTHDIKNLENKKAKEKIFKLIHAIFLNINASKCIECLKNQSDNVCRFKDFRL